MLIAILTIWLALRAVALIDVTLNSNWATAGAILLMFLLLSQ